MTNKRFKLFIENILKNENIRIPPASAFYNFHDVGKNWNPDWTEIFKKILNDIKAGVNYDPDVDNPGGFCVVKGPLVNTGKWLSVYFTKQYEEYTIYMIKLEKPNDVFLKNFNSIG